MIAPAMVGLALSAATAGMTMAAPPIGEEAVSWTNPLMPQRADPHVSLQPDGYYYMMATVPAYDRLELRRARTLAGLSNAKAVTIWLPHKTGPMATPVWAPELHRVRGRWYVYFAAGEAGQPWDHIRNYALENRAANPLEGAWRERGQIAGKWDSFSLDPTSFAVRGVRYFVWTQVEPGRNGSNIMIARMVGPTRLGAVQSIIARPEHDWEKQTFWVNEAPSVLIRAGKVFMTFSASATDAKYCVGLLHADIDADLLDPASWTKLPHPVLKSDTVAGQYGPGHNSFTTTKDGKADIIVYHARSYEKIEGGSLANPDRATRAQAVRWSADGMPILGPPVPDGPYSIDTTTSRAARARQP